MLTHRTADVLLVYCSRRLASAFVLPPVRGFSRCSARRHLPSVTGRSVQNDRRSWRMTDDKLFGDGRTDRRVSLSPITHANTTIIQLTQTRHGPHAMMHPRAKSKDSPGTTRVPIKGIVESSVLARVPRTVYETRLLYTMTS